ncbi:fibronectin type III domain-containing protein [Jatrophihabitans fulvus]
MSVLALAAAQGSGVASAATDPWAPFGAANPFTQAAGGVRMTGWAIDPSAATKPVTMSAWVDGKRVTTFVADRDLPALAKKHPRAGTKHAFDAVVPAPEGARTICVRAIDLPANKTSTLLQCTGMTLNYGPRSMFDRPTLTPGHITLSGWAVDPDSSRSQIQVVTSLDGGSATTTTASLPRTDVTKALGAYPGNNHGFKVTYPASQGTHRVCATATNIRFGKNQPVGCMSVTLDDAPFGRFDSLAQQGESVALRGWAIDRDKPTSPVTMTMRVDGGAAQHFAANATRTDVAKVYPGTGSAHGFIRTLSLGEGKHSVCLSMANVGYGSSRALGCRTVSVNHAPSAALTGLTATRTGFAYTGWATDPDTTAAVSVRLTVDGRTAATVAANKAGGPRPGHAFTGTLPSTSGTHKVCAIAVNRGAGTKNSAASCRTVALALSPLGGLTSLTRVGDDIRVTGWGFDPDSTAAASAVITVDGKVVGTYRTGVTRTDVAKLWPSAGTKRGFAPVVKTDDWKHTVCVTVKNVGGGKDLSLGCKLIIAVDPKAPAAPTGVKATSGYGSSTVTWTAPTNDGGAPPSKYVVTASPGGRSVTVSGTVRSATVTGLSSNTLYTFGVRAVNVAGASTAGVSTRVRTQNGPPPQTTPAPVSTSRYMRNITSCTTGEFNEMYGFGALDARNNPSGHKYMMLLDIGGQSRTYGGVVLSATTRFVSYSNLLRCSKAYVAGYASAMKAGAPAMITIGVNNDMDVSYQTGVDWAVKIVNPLVAYGKQWSAKGLTISGANDIEPGFRGSASATRSWLSGYLASTSAKFVFNGSADGCAWTVTNRGCNNGWSMIGLHWMAGGAAPTRIINLPQVYNFTMADQWKYISLTGVEKGLPRIVFGGPLTEVTACAQARSCGSISGPAAWKRMWSNLQSHPRLKVGSLPYSTDLRIDY